MLKTTTILFLALFGAGAHAAQPSDETHDTPTMAAADAPLEHDCVNAVDQTCEDKTMENEAQSNGVVWNEVSIQVLARFANALSVRYQGAPVYLVGGALADSDPRDIDIVVIVNDETFWRAYAYPDGTIESALLDWSHGGSMVPPSRVWARWARDCVKQARNLTAAIGGPLVDFKVQPSSHAEQYRDRPRRLLSTWHTDSA